MYQILSREIRLRSRGLDPVVAIWDRLAIQALKMAAGEADLLSKRLMLEIAERYEALSKLEHDKVGVHDEEE
jgi:hypothetical protein